MGTCCFCDRQGAEHHLKKISDRMSSSFDLCSVHELFFRALPDKEKDEISLFCGMKMFKL